LIDRFNPLGAPRPGLEGFTEILRLAKDLSIPEFHDADKASMSRYLVDRIAALPNVELHTRTEIVGLEGDKAQGLTTVTFRSRDTGATHRCPLRHVFLFIGADPNVRWLDGCIATDEKGFVVTGVGSAGRLVNGRPALPLETSHPGVFAVGDIRAGSTKRVAAAVGEGAAAVAQIHSVLASE